LQEELWRRAGISPYLSLQPARYGTLTNIALGDSPLIYSRIGAGTRIGSTGLVESSAADAFRIQHDPITLERLGLLVEEQRTNVLTFSENTNSGFLGLRAIISSDVIAAPTGTVTADKIVEDSTASASHYLYRYPAITTNTTYTYSVFLKSAERSYALIGFNNSIEGNGVRVGVDLNAGTIGAPFVIGSGSGAAASIQSVGNGWYRVVLSGIVDTTSTLGLCTIYLATSILTSGTPSYTGNGTSGLYAWGAHLEAGALPLSYIPTTTAQATRGDDILTYDSFSRPIGTIYAEFRNPGIGTRGIFSANDNTANNRIELSTSGTSMFLTVVSGGTTQASINAGTFTANALTKVAARIVAGGFAVSLNGAAEVVVNTGTVPTINRLQIGRTQAGDYLNGTLARLDLFEQPTTGLGAMTQ
jgi:hypothetical protein